MIAAILAWLPVTLPSRLGPKTRRCGGSCLRRAARFARLQFGDGNAARSMIRSSSSSSSSDSLSKSYPTLSSTACGGLPCPRSKSATAAEIRAVAGALPSRITAASVSIASCVSTRAAVLTVTKICLAAIVSGRRGRPQGLPLTPGFQLVLFLPPRDISYVLSPVWLSVLKWCSRDSWTTSDVGAMTHMLDDRTATACARRRSHAATAHVMSARNGNDQDLASRLTLQGRRG
jgi:hypothetical protein